MINKVDLPHADPAAASAEIAASLGLPVETHMRISAKSGLGVENVLGNIVDNLPAPEAWIGDGQGRLRGLVFDTLCVLCTVHLRLKAQSMLQHNIPNGVRS